MRVFVREVETGGNGRTNRIVPVLKVICRSSIDERVFPRVNLYRIASEPFPARPGTFTTRARCLHVSSSATSVWRSC